LTDLKHAAVKGFLMLAGAEAICLAVFPQHVTEKYNLEGCLSSAHGVFLPQRFRPLFVTRKSGMHRFTVIGGLLSIAGFAGAANAASQDVDIGTVRVSYRFGGPVVAKY
jgi:hypothetical protein